MDVWVYALAIARTGPGIRVRSGPLAAKVSRCD